MDSYTGLIIKGIFETLYMVIASTGLGYLFGLPLGVALAVTDENGIKPNKAAYRIMDFIVNIGRSIPFLILLILLIPFTKMIVGKSYGTTATIVPLTISAIPFIGRMVESSIKEVDHGVIEAAQSLGASTFTIIRKVLLGEARISILNGAVIAVGTIIGYSAMAGAVGAGGLGNYAIMYGHDRNQLDVTWFTIVVLVIVVNLIQLAGNKIIKRNKH